MSCPANKIRNPTTGKCISPRSKAGQRILDAIGESYRNKPRKVRQRKSYKGKLYGCNKLRSNKKCDFADSDCQWCPGSKIHGQRGACLTPSQYKRRCTDWRPVYSQNTGSKIQVWNGTALKTSGGLQKSDLKINKWGDLVSKRASAVAKARYEANKENLADAGFHPRPKTPAQMAAMRPKRKGAKKAGPARKRRAVPKRKTAAKKKASPKRKAAPKKKATVAKKRRSTGKAKVAAQCPPCPRVAAGRPRRNRKATKRLGFE